LGFEFRASDLQSKSSTAWSATPVHFALVIFGVRIWRTICLGWPRVTIIPISNSQIARIIGLTQKPEQQGSKVVFIFLCRERR
jgi:hypothetical protein